MFRRWLTICLCLGCALLACSPQDSPVTPAPTQPSPPAQPTPEDPALHDDDIESTGPRLRVTLPSITLLKRAPDQDAQVLLVLADPHGAYSYLLYPANRPGDTTDEFDLTEYPLELSVDESTSSATLWILAFHNRRYQIAERLGLDALASTLASGFRAWIAEGDPAQDPLAAVVSASNGALFEWFATIDVLGQAVATFRPEGTWPVGLESLRSADGGLSAVYTMQYLSSAASSAPPDPSSTLRPDDVPTLSPADRSGYVLRLDDPFSENGGESIWYQGRDNTFTNQVVNGAYEIALINIEQRDHAVSWGSIEGQRFEDYVVEAEVRMVEEDVEDGRLGIWFNYQDDYNFIYFGVSTRDEYRVAIIQRNQNRIEVQDWTSHVAIRPVTAGNLLTIETSRDGSVALSINGERVRSFNDETFTSGSIAFFCYARSVPATCRLERIRIWEPE
jgi:hypothetical protein